MSSFDPQSLIPQIRSILQGADLSTVSARQVRRQLSEQDSSLTPDLLKSHKHAIDDIVMSIFDALAAPPSDVSNDDDDDDDGEDEDENDDASESPPPAKKQPSSTTGSFVKSKVEPLSDAELAQRLFDQLNRVPGARSTRASSSSTSGTAKGKGKSKANVKKTAKTNTPSSSKSKKNTVLSQATIDSSDDEDLPHGTKKAKRKRLTDPDETPKTKPKKPKKEPKTEGETDGEAKKGGVFMKPWGMSAPLSALLGGQSQLPRPQVVKQIWAYVKENNIQDPTNKSFFLCDDRMQAVFKTPRLHMFTMNKLLSDHLYPVEEAQ